MKLNRSLAISSKIQECKRGNIIGLLDKGFPTSVLQESPRKKSRNRIFTSNNTLLTMVLTATQADKTLKNSVALYYLIHQHHRRAARQALQEAREKEKQLDAKKESRQAQEICRSTSWQPAEGYIPEYSGLQQSTGPCADRDEWKVV